MQTESAPYLDTIETTDFCETSEKPHKFNDSMASALEKVYSEALENDNSEAIISGLEFYKHQGETMADMLIKHNSMLTDRAEKIKHCGTYVETCTDPQTGKEKLLNANFCRQRICPSCQRRRSLKVAADINKIRNELDDCEWVHLVLTVPNCQAVDLTKMVNRMYKCSSEFFRDKRVKQGFKGVLRCLEVTYSKDNVNGISCDSETDSNNILYEGSYHPHLHCLCCVKKWYFTSRYYLDHDLLMWKWIYYWGADRLLQVHAGKVKDDGAIAEVAKYCVKPLELDLEDSERVIVLEHLFNVLHGRRLLQTYGEVREAAKKARVDLNADDEDKPIGYNVVNRYSYDHNKGRYDYTDSEVID